jgi:hypothetical protein
MTELAAKESSGALCAIAQSCGRMWIDDEVINRNTNATVLGIGVVAAVLLAFPTCGGNSRPTGGMMSWWR